MMKARRKRSRPKASVRRVASKTDIFTTLCKPEVVLHGLPPPPPGYEVEIHHQQMDFGMTESFAVTLTPKMGYPNLRRYGLSMAVTREALMRGRETVIDYVGTGIRKMYEQCVTEAIKAYPAPMQALCGTTLVGQTLCGTALLAGQELQRNMTHAIDAMIMGKLVGKDYIAHNENDCGEPEEDAPKKSTKQTWKSNSW